MKDFDQGDDSKSLNKTLLFIFILLAAVILRGLGW